MDSRRIRLESNRYGGVDGFVGTCLVISIWRDRIQSSRSLSGDIQDSTAVVECQRRAIALYQKNHTPIESPQ
jgi:hypothetical protein